MEGTNGDHNMIDCSDDDERENRSVRSVVRVAQETKASVDAMLRSTANETPDCEVKKESRLSDWTVLRAQMEALCGDVMGGPRKGIRMRPKQDVAEFCVVLEKLAKKAYPEGNMEDRSLEFAHTLLSNLKDWPEHIQLLSALHRVRPENAYNEVKQLALNIELSRKMYDDNQRISDVITSARSMGVKSAKTVAQKKPLIGRKIVAWARLLDTRIPALLDTGSMISIVPVGVLARAKDRGVDVDSLEVIPARERMPVYDASNNEMQFLGATKISVQLEEGGRSEVAFHITDSPEDEVLLGTNALEDLGVELKIAKRNTEESSGGQPAFRKVRVAKRKYIPPHGSGVLSARCEVRDAEEGVLWPTKRGLECGVFKVSNQEIAVPVVNDSEEPMVLGEGEEIGYWGTEKWKESWEEFNPLMVAEDAEQMKREYDKRHSVDVGKHAKVGDRVYLLSPNEKTSSSHPKLACEWSGPYRVLETSQNSALITRIGENSDPIRVQFDMLRVVPNCISDEPVDTRTKRGKRGRKPVKSNTCNLMRACFSGAVLLSPLEKGHLMFKCSDGCFDDAKLRDIPNCSFPGAVAREPITTLWDAWLATSIFQRTDISLGEKIKLHREGAACYEASALKNVLKMAFDKCIDWTDFITNTQRIRQHGSIQGHHFESSYDEALQTVRKELTEDAIRSRPQKKGPIGFMAGEGALPLEKDGQRGDVVTKMVTTFDRLMELLEEWSTFRTWVMVWPLDARMDEDKMKRLLKITREHLQNGGKVVTIWPPINERNSAKWRELAELWSTLDNALERIDDGNQVFRTASSVTVDGRLYIEAGSPEGSGQFFTSHIGAGVPKYVYEAARKKAVGAMLPPLPDCRFVTSRAMSTEGAGMLGLSTLNRLSSPGEQPIAAVRPLPLPTSVSFVLLRPYFCAVVFLSLIKFRVLRVVFVLVAGGSVAYLSVRARVIVHFGKFLNDRAGVRESAVGGFGNATWGSQYVAGGLNGQLHLRAMVY
ncbi:unnamed protein product [Heligmosomoides polygyrus]|uniref:Reverse transcriptase domain-containing protein n=1 Tax=Heligmosomoides polygyrus TaxID=6339 RepID=A0A183GNL9_HELPZ|nr:unnamed protein product [Heligmosomoides polygyrus]